MATREANLVGHLSPEKGNMWRLIYETSHTVIQTYWKYAHHYGVQYSHTNKEYYSWDKFNQEISTSDIVIENWTPPKDFDPRFYYYSRDVNLTEQLSTEEGRKTTEEAEVAKTALYTMNEFPSLEMKLISEDSELERGKKRGLEGAVQPPPQQRRQGASRVSSVPPGSATAMARQRAAAMNPKQPSGQGIPQGRGWETVVTGKLPPDFKPVSSIVYFGDAPIEERKKKIYHQSLYDTAWHNLQGILTSLGTSEDNLPAFECTFIHWFRAMETSPMNIPIEALIQPLYEEEKAAYFADLSQDTPEDVVALHKAIIIDSLTNVKNFMSSFGLIVKDFFDPNKSRFTLHPIKGGKGGKGEAFPALSGKPIGKSGSTNRPKEPNPLPKQGGSVPLVLHKPPTKAGGTTTPLVAKQLATPKPGVGSTVTVEPVPKTESAVLEQPKAKGEAGVVADPPKSKGEAVSATEQPKAKVETVTQQHPPKAQGKAAAVTDQPKADGQSKPLLSLAGIKGRLGLGPSKPARPPPLSQDDSAQLEEDEDVDVQAAIQESFKTPTSPQVQSGAQSSTSKPMLDLDQQESDLMTQLDKLMAETLRILLLKIVLV